jgi:hypothetical protein
MTYKEYERISKNHSDLYIDSLDSEFVESLSSEKAIVISTKEKYIVTYYSVDQMGKVIISFDREVTKEEAIKVSQNQASIGIYDQLLPKGNSGQQSWQTASKLLFISAYSYNGYEWIDVQCHWYTTPIVKSFDIIATRWTGNYIVNDATGAQEYWDNSSINYSYLGSNMVKYNNGVGISMNLVDSGATYKLYLNVKGTGTFGHAYGTYQHATSNISLSTSKSYTFSSTGLGGVLNHNYSSYFDNMQGVMIT